MRLTVLTTSFPLEPGSPSGIFVERLVTALPPEIDSVVLTPAGAGGGAAAPRRYGLLAVAYAPARVRRLAHGPGGIPDALERHWWSWPLVPLLLVALFVSCIRQGRNADVIHAHWSVCGVIAGLAGKLLRKPVVTTLRGSDVTRAGSSRAYRSLLGLCAALNDRLVVVSRHMLPELARLAGAAAAAKASFVPNGVDEELLRLPLRAERARPRRLLTVASLVAGKGVDTVIAALARDSTADDELVIAGEGAQEPELRRLAGVLGVARRVRFLGRVAPEAMRDVYAAADVFVLASRAEGRPNVVVEAMASGLPVVATNIPGIREIVEPGRTGLLFEPGDADGLASRLRELAASPSLGRTLAQAARERLAAEGLTWAAAGARYAQLYADVLAARGHAPSR